MFRIVSIAYLKLKINTFTRQFLFMALWRVLDKTSAPLRGASSTRLKPTQRNKQNRETAEKAKAAAKIGRRGKPLALARFFYAAAFFAFSLRRVFLSAVLFAPSFWVRLLYAVNSLQLYTAFPKTPLFAYRL